MEAPGAQTRKLATQAPQDSREYGYMYKEGDKGSNSEPMHTDFRRWGIECTPLSLR